MNSKLRSLFIALMCLTVFVLLKPSFAQAQIAPSFSGGLKFEVEGAQNAELTGTADLDLNMKIDVRGSNRVYLEVGVSPGVRALGSTTYMWGSWDPQIRRAWLQHDGALFHGGQTVSVRVGHSPTTISHNMGKIERFQGVRISDIYLNGLNTMFLFGWDAATNALPKDEIQGIATSARIWGADISASVLRSAVADKTLWEIKVRRPVTRSIDFEALQFSDGNFQPFFYTLSSPLGATSHVSVTAYDYGQYDAGRYQYTGEEYLHFQYANKHYGMKGSVDGTYQGLAWEVAYDTWDDLLIRHHVTGLRLSRDFGPVHVAYEREYDGSTSKELANKISASSQVNLFKALPDLKVGLTYDWIASKDQRVISAEYMAPNSMTYKIEHGQDTGFKWRIQSSINF